MRKLTIDTLIRIAGTDYDRKRKLTNKDIEDIRCSYNKGRTIGELAREYGVAYNTIHYHVDDEYKEFHNQRRLTSTRSKYNRDAAKSRIAYKKSLLARISI